MKVHVISSTEFLTQGTGVHSAFTGMVDLLKTEKDIEVCVNEAGSGDICHSHSYGLYYFMKSLPYKGRRIHTVHTTPATLKGSIAFSKLIMPFARQYFKTVYNFADVCIAISPTVEKDLRELGVTTKIVNIPNPISFKNWKFSPERREKGRKMFQIDAEAFVVLGVGQLQRRKGVEDFIDMAAQLPHIQFVWAGARPFKGLTDGIMHINEKIENATPNVRFVGQVDMADMPYLYAASDTFVFPSYQENCPLAPMEAAAMGLPVIFRDLKEYTTLYQNDYLKAKKVTDFSFLVNLIHEDPTYRQYAKQVSEALVKPFDQEEIRTKLLDLYQSVFQNYYFKSN